MCHIYLGHHPLESSPAQTMLKWTEAHKSHMTAYVLLPLISAEYIQETFLMIISDFMS